MDAQALLGASAEFFLFLFQTTWSGNNRFNREAGQGLQKNYEVLVVRCGVANARTLQCHSGRIFPASPIERIHRHDSPGQSMQPPATTWDLHASSTRNFVPHLEPQSSNFQNTAALSTIAVRVDTMDSVCTSATRNTVGGMVRGNKLAGWGFAAPVKDTVSPFQKKFSGGISSADFGAEICCFSSTAESR